VHASPFLTTLAAAEVTSGELGSRGPLVLYVLKTLAELRSSNTFRAADGSHPVHPIGLLSHQPVKLLGGGEAGDDEDGLLVALSRSSDNTFESADGSLWFSRDSGSREAAAVRVGDALAAAADHLRPHVAQGGSWEVRAVLPPTAAAPMYD
jgi:hypothetical protein